MTKKRLLVRTAIFILVMILSIPGFSQNRMVTGKVTDSAGAPIFGASVTALGVRSGTTTGIDGVFHLNVPVSAQTLIISYLGYASRQVPISGGLISVSLRSSNSTQNEVVVIGYG